MTFPPAFRLAFALLMVFGFAPGALGQGGAADTVAAGVEHTPGVVVEVFELDESPASIPRLIDGQTPNLSRVMDAIALPPESLALGPKSTYTRFTGELLVPEAGRYGFLLESDDGSRLILDQRVVVDHDGPHPMSGRQGEAQLTAGAHPFELEHFQGGGAQGLKLSWRLPGRTGFTEIPAEALRAAAGLTHVVSPGDKAFVRPGSDRRPGDGRPLESVHPMWKLVTLEPQGPEGFKPQVAGMAYAGDGRLLITTFDPRNNGVEVDQPNGALWTLDHADGSPGAVEVKLAADGLVNPLGVLVREGWVYVAERDRVLRLQDADGDGHFETRETVASGWISDNYHHFTFGPVIVGEKLYATLSSSFGMQGRTILRERTFGHHGNPPHRGTLLEVDLSTGEKRFLAGGLRTPNGLFVGPGGELLVGENQGNWKPTNGLYHLKEGRFYGYYGGNARTEEYPQGMPASPLADRPVSPLAIDLPHGRIANSPTAGVNFTHGPFAGQSLISDVKHGGLRRVSWQEVDGELQGSAFRHSQGFNAGLNRLAWGDDGTLFVGGIGERKSWSWRGTTQGLQRLEPTGETVFEFLDFRATPEGFHVTFTEPADAAQLADPALAELTQWTYRPTSNYGGPRFELETLAVTAAVPDADGRGVQLTVPGRKPGRTVGMRLPVRSAGGEPIWSPDAWHTLNRIPAAGAPLTESASPGPATASAPDADADAADADAANALTRVLVFTKTERFRHRSIPEGIEMLRSIGVEYGLDTIFTEDSTFFTEEDLARFDAIVFLNTSGDVLNGPQQRALQTFVRGGGGWVGIHAATDTEHQWPWYGQLAGARFAGHPKPSRATCHVVDADHPATAHLPAEWKRTDEWYNFRQVQPGLRVLLNLDETTYEGGKMGENHPIAWCREFDGGRSFYTGGGHTRASYAEPDFRQHVTGGLLWALGQPDRTPGE